MEKNLIFYSDTASSRSWNLGISHSDSEPSSVKHICQKQFQQARQASSSFIIPRTGK